MRYMNHQNQNSDYDVLREAIAQDRPEQMILMLLARCAFPGSVIEQLFENNHIGVVEYRNYWDAFTEMISTLENIDEEIENY